MFVSLSGKKWRAIPPLLMDDVDGLGFMRVHVITNREFSGKVPSDLFPRLPTPRGLERIPSPRLSKPSVWRSSTS
jgi:hypothetical protein